ncbi:MAG: alpha/beta hydrolase [Chloroflexia bacterium]
MEGRDDGALRRGAAGRERRAAAPRRASPSNVSTPRAVVAVSHGFGEHGGRYSNLVEHIVPRGYAVYALDHQGHGRSGGRRGHVGRWSEYLTGSGRCSRRCVGGSRRRRCFSWATASAG